MRLGGQMLFKSEVEKIIVDEKGVRGIRLKDGSIIRSRNIISTIDIKLHDGKPGGTGYFTRAESGLCGEIGFRPDDHLDIYRQSRYR